MKLVHKALAAVLRKGSSGPEILVFRHPKAGVQLPKGTVEPGETIEDATHRELHEESGLKTFSKSELLGTWDRVVGGGPNEDGPLETNRWWVSLLWTEHTYPDRWDHRAEGSPEENGLIFSFFWLPVDAQLSNALDPLFAHVSSLILDHIQGSKGNAGTDDECDEVLSRLKDIESKLTDLNKKT